MTQIRKFYEADGDHPYSGGSISTDKPITLPIQAEKREGERESEDAAWTQVINDARFYDGTPAMLMRLIYRFKGLGYKLITNKG